MMFILKFLVPLKASFLLFSVMGKDPSPEQSKIQATNAANVDAIAQRLEDQFLAQATLDDFDEVTKTPMKKAEFGGVTKEPIKLFKAPDNCHGALALQLALYDLLSTMASTHYSSTVGGVSPASPTCGTDLLRNLNNSIAPVSTATNTQAKRTYKMHKESFKPTTNFVPWWSTLLLLQLTKFNLGIADSTRFDALEDACDTIEENTGTDSRWSMEIMSWKMRSAAEEAKAPDVTTLESKVVSFENHMRLHQQKRDQSKTKEQANATIDSPGPKTFCTWCFKNKEGSPKFNNHTESNCKSKRAKEGGDVTTRPTRTGGICFACNSREHQLNACPVYNEFKASQAAKACQANTTSAPNVSDNKEAASANQYLPTQRPVPTSPRRANLASALMTTALLASSATSTRAHLDTAATATMGPFSNFLQNQTASNRRIAVANGHELDNSREGLFVCHSADGDLPVFKDALVNGDLTDTLISGPQAVFELKQDIVLSERHGLFMQPSTSDCPVCNTHADRINFDGNRRGFTVEIFPGPAPVSALHTEDVEAPFAAAEEAEVVAPNAPVKAPVIAVQEKVASCLTVKQVIPICDPRDPDGETNQLNAFIQARSTIRKFAPSISANGIARFQLLHTCMGGAVTKHNIGEFIKNYPEYAKSIKLPQALQEPCCAKHLLPCHCCSRTKMRKENSPQSSSKMPAPLEEVHLDLFTYPNDPRYDAFFIDRSTRACWHYVLAKKSDLPKIVQQFIVDVNTITDYPVGSIFSTIESTKKYGIDATAVNAYLTERKRPQRLRILYTDGAGESASEGFEEFLADLDIQHLMSIPESQHQNALAEHGGGWRLVNMVRHDMDLSGLGATFRRFCSSLNAQRMNFLPHSALQGRTPASVLYPSKSLPFRYFLPFGCKATVLKGAATRKANKLDPRGRDGVYVGTAAPYGMQGFLVYVFSESGKGQGTVVVSTHAKFDLTYFPARRTNKRVKDFFSTLGARADEQQVLTDLLDDDGLLELEVNDNDDDLVDAALVELTAEQDAELTAEPDGPVGPAWDLPVDAEDVLPPLESLFSTPPTILPDLAATKKPTAAATPEIDKQLAACLDISTPLRAAQFVAPLHLHYPEPDEASDSESDESPASLHEKIAEIEARARTDAEPGRRLRSGTVQARATGTYASHHRNFIKNIITAASGYDVTPNILTDLYEHARSARAFADQLNQRGHLEHAMNANDVLRAIGCGTVAPQDRNYAQDAIAHIKSTRKERNRFVTDVNTGERIDVELDSYYDLGINDLDPDGRIQTSSFQRLLVKALKTTIKAHPDREEVLTPHLKLLRTPKSAKAALASPQWREWRAAIDKELASLVDKGVYEVRKIPPGTKAIPTKLVLRIKLNSDGTVDKYKVRCVALGFLQRAGLHYHPDECYSPMSDPSTTRTLVAVSNALNLNIDHLDVSVAYLNGVLPADQRFFCLPPPGFEESSGYGWYMLKGLYGTRQGGALWAKTFRDWMRQKQPQFVEAGNERVCYVFREGHDGLPIDLDKLRGITLEPDEKLIILCMNTDDMMISYTDNARHLVDEFERSLNASYACTPRVPLEFYLGMHVQRDRSKGVLSIDVRRHIYDFIRSMGLDPFSSASVSTPLDPNLSYSKADCPPTIDAEIKERVLRAHGKLIHMAIWARPDLAHCVSMLGRYVHNPSQKHLDAYIRVARYLIKTKDLRIVYGTHDIHGLVLYGFSDSDWGADLDNFKSTGAYIFFLDGAACSWKVKLSSTALLSSQESEYVAGSEATKEALNLRMLLEHLGFGDPQPTTVYFDNKGAITMGLHPANKPATRHVNMRMHMCRQHVELGHVVTPYCRTYDMVADYMTKATPKPTHERHNARVMGDQSIAPPLPIIHHLLD